MRDFCIERADLLRLSMRLVGDFRTSFGTQRDRDIVLARVVCDGVEGYGELVAGTAPLYSEETVGTALSVLREYLLPRVLGHRFAHPADVADAWAPVRGNRMARATVETAVWDAWARLRGIPLVEALGGSHAQVATGVSVGIQDSVTGLLDEIARYLEAGYARIKVKIEPGWDVGVIRQVRSTFGDIRLMADANSAYALADAEHLRRLDEFGLEMIEQPLGHDDIIDHAALQARLETPVCLDESIHSAEDARRALDLGSCRIINVKLGRLGGHTEALRLHDLCVARGVPLWCGGMLESGVGRLHNIALASLPGFTLPGDTSASDRYWHHDVIDPPVTIAADGTVATPEGSVADRVSKDLLERFVVSEESYRPETS